MTLIARIDSYFSLPTDLATELRGWSEFKSGDGYQVRLESSDGSEVVESRLVDPGDDESEFLEIRGSVPGSLFDRVLGRIVFAMAAHSDNLVISRRDSS